MSDIEKHIEFVNGQMTFHERQAERFSDDLRRSELHRTTADKFRSLLDYLEKLKNAGETPLDKSSGATRLSLSWEEIEGLPDELLAELSISESDKLDFHIVAAVRDLGGIASLDRLLVAIFKSTGEIHKRQNLNARIYRLVQKDMLFSVPGKKGVYSIKPVDDETAATLL